MQCLLPKIGGNGRVADFEILIANSAIRNLIRMGKSQEIPNVLATASREGMQTLDQALAKLVKTQMVTQEAALMKSSTPAQLLKLL
jgi:twitching motility protein PilT